MNSSPGYIVAGFLVVALIGFVLVTAYTFSFLKILKIKLTLSWNGILLATVAWLLSTIIPVMFISGMGLLPFVAVLVILFALSGFLLGYKVLRLNLRQAIFYSIGFSAIINPVWYFLFQG